jgi:hypothetical protein
VSLGTGDSLHHDGTTPHRWVLQGDEPAEVVIVVGDPTSRDSSSVHRTETHDP